jgi:FKBP-type peptidyl-prolyl cis-trans isomerase FklB
MKYPVTLSVIAACLFPAIPCADEALDFQNETTRINYSLGYQIGGDFKRQEVEMDAAAVVQGIEDALSGAAPKMSAADMRDTLVELKRRVVASQRERNQQNELEYLEEGRKFLEENGRREGVVTTESGLQYEIVEPGSGASPGPQDTVTVHYRGTLIDGKEFDSSYRKNKPATFRLDGVIKGWSEGLQLMKEGAKYRLFIPNKLAYGSRGPLEHRTLIFDVELLEVQKPEEAAATE